MFGTPEAVHVFGGLVHQGVDHVVYRHNADDGIGLVHHWNGQKVVAAYQLGHGLLVRQGLHGNGAVATPQFGQGRLRVGTHQLAQRHHKLQLLLVVDHIDGIDRFAGTFHFPNVLQGLCHIPAHGHLQKLGSHDAAGCVCRIVHQTHDGGAGVLGQATKNLLLVFMVQVLQQVGHSVFGQLLQHWQAFGTCQLHQERTGPTQLRHFQQGLQAFVVQLLGSEQRGALLQLIQGQNNIGNRGLRAK